MAKGRQTRVRMMADAFGGAVLSFWSGDPGQADRGAKQRKDTREVRRALIEESAFSLLAEKRFAGTSVQAIARRASASNETLYRWFGDKTGLFRATGFGDLGVADQFAGLIPGQP